MVPDLGEPVICHGLKSCTALNGKVGDVRGRDEGTGRFVVHFEGIEKPKLVKLDNLKLAFDLPEKEEEEE